MTLPEALQAYTRALHQRHVKRVLWYSVRNHHNDNSLGVVT